MNKKLIEILNKCGISTYVDGTIGFNDIMNACQNAFVWDSLLSDEEKNILREEVKKQIVN